MIIKQHKSINSKRLIDDIDEFVCDILKHEYLRWRNPEKNQKAIEVIKLLMSEYKEKGTITSYKVIHNRKNNPQRDFDCGIYHVEIHFYQTHCLNKTQLHYIFGTGVQKRA